MSINLNAQGGEPNDNSFTPEEIWRAGLPDIQNFTPEDYGASSQNWAFAEGNDGLMYFGNGNGVIEYDGHSWRVIQLPENSTVRSLSKSDNGTIYVGAVGEFGYLGKDELGSTHYISLIDKLEEDNKEFGDIWSIGILNNTVFFQSKDFLFRWNGDDFRVWRPKVLFENVFVVHESVFVISKDEGILTPKGDVLNLIPSGDYFAKHIDRIQFMEALKDDQILIGLWYGGLYSYDGRSFNEFNSEAQQLLQEESIYCGKALNNGNFAIATLNSGVFILDGASRKILEHFRLEQGLLSNSAVNLFNDSKGILWLASGKGISKIELLSPIRKFDRRKGLNEFIFSAIYDKDNLWVGSEDLYRLDRKKQQIYNGESEFNKIETDLDENIRFIIPFASSKVVVSTAKMADVKKGGKIQVIKTFDSALLSHLKSAKDENTLYLGTQNGVLYECIKKKDAWEFSALLDLKAPIVDIVEDSIGSLWLVTYANGVYKIKSSIDDSKSDMRNSIQKYNTDSGLTSLVQLSIFFLENELYISSPSDGLFRFYPRTQKFVKDTILMPNYEARGIEEYGPVGKDVFGNVWQTVRGNLPNQIYKISGNEIFELKEYNAFSDFQTENMSAFDSIVFFSGPKGALAYNQNTNRPKYELSNVQIRKVLLESDSLVYAGKGGGNQKVIPFRLNAMELQYSLPFYTRSDKNKYQYQLAGFDENWSSWSFDTKKYYTNIPEGNYTFKVKAKNIFGEISEEDSYSFTILPPWYRTWWAYALYGLGAILTLILFSQWRSEQLKAKNLALEKVVDARTQEIKSKNLQLENQTEKLKELDTMKTRLFANISHEFRTPLTLIKGPVEKMEEAGETKLSMTNVKMIRRNANRLLKLVNQLLDLSKLDSGKLRLNAAEGDIFKCLRAAASSFSSHAAQRDIDYQISIPSQPLWANFDRDKIEKITYNLLSNAFKFTQDKGKIKFTVSYRGERLQLIVSDSGQGIEKDKLPHIFDRFFQVDDSYTREKAGSGIGLALTKELVDLMEGEIYVESEFGKGSVFKVVMNMEEIKSHNKETSEEYKVVQQDVIETDTPPAQTEKKAQQVLIIEDNNDMRHFIKEQLQGDYEVLEAFNGKEGLKKAKKMVPDLIITDLMMPQMDGTTLCKELKVGIHTSHIPVVMLTAKAGIENKLEGLETGADDYLTKPFNARELQVRVKNLINKRQKLRELFAQKPDINPKEITVTSLDEKFLNQVLELFEEKHIESEFGVPQMQDALGMSKTQLHRKLKALTDHPPGELLRNFRLKRAAQLLLQKGENVSQIAYAVGFNGLSYFTKCFKELYGVAPSEYAEKGPSDL